MHPVAMICMPHHCRFCQPPAGISASCHTIAAAENIMIMAI
jgi:hypothetical protein